MGRHGKIKLSLIGTIGVSILAVSSAAVSTFAWYQAQASVDIDVSGEASTEITVSAPDALRINASLYAYNGNSTTGHASSVSSFSFSDFSQVSSSSTRNLWPGKQMSFAVVLSASSDLPDMNITVSSLNVTNAVGSNRVVLSYSNSTWSETSARINIQDTIQMTGYFTTSTTFSANSRAGGYISTTQQTKINLNESWSGSSFSASTVYFFYTIEFKDDSSYPRYKEYKKIVSEQTTTYSEQEETPLASYAGNRYFLQDNTYGNSTCYAGLSLGLTGLTVSLG